MPLSKSVDVTVTVRNFRTLETKGAVVTTNDDAATSTDRLARARWCRTIALKYAESEDGWLANEVDVAIDPNSPRDSPAATGALQSVTIHVAFTNSETGGGGQATVTTRNMDAVSASEAVRATWIASVRREFAELEGWPLGQTKVVIDESVRVPETEVLERNTKILARRAGLRLSQDKLLFEVASAVVVLSRAGEDTTALERRLVDSPGMLHLIAGGWDVCGALVELFRLERQPSRRGVRVRIEDLDDKFSDASDRMLVSLFLPTVQEMGFEEADRLMLCVVSGEASITPPPLLPPPPRLERNLSAGTLEEIELMTAMEHRALSDDGAFDSPPAEPLVLGRSTYDADIELAIALSMSQALERAPSATGSATSGSGSVTPPSSCPGVAMLTGPCPICFDDEGEAFWPAGCAHVMHRTCAVRMIRNALGSARSSVLPEGVRCPCSGSSGCNQFLTIQDCARLVSTVVTNGAAAGRGGTAAPTSGGAEEEPGDDEAELQPAEFESLTRYAIEAAVPESEKLFCPRCERMLLLASPGALPHGGAHCPHCDHRWDPRAAAGEDDATREFLDATSKKCPTCGVRSTHYHGHDCHHIGYGQGGCLTCKQHWCYVCERKHGAPEGDGSPAAFTSMGASKHPDCTHGSSFCIPQGITDHLVPSPYPHDSRCGCPVCPTCRPGKPCEQCSGSCIVCRGAVPPGPSGVM